MLTTLFGKEWRELATSRAWVILLVVLGPLVGHAFITAVDSYAEVSGAGGGPAALAQGISPLDGIIVPTFGAYAIAATLLFPFVAIRLVSAEKQSGALKLLLQAPVSLGTMLWIKLLVLVTAWVLAWVPGFVALALWRAYGGHIAGGELSTVLTGHLLRATLTCALAMAAASVTDNAATAAVVTLAMTLGTWALDFIAQVRGGVALALDMFTPESALRTFETGEIRVAIVLVTIILAAGAVGVAIWCLQSGLTRRRRLLGSVATVMACGLLAWLAANARASWDASEDRRNSFAVADERALAGLRDPLRITVYLAPEDPRLADLQRGVLHKLRRTMHDVTVAYASSGGSGMFAQPGAHYGEVWYAMRGHRAMSRSTTEPIVLETVYEVAGITPPTSTPGSSYPGYPLVAHPRSAALIFYLLWPVLVLAAWWWMRRPRRTSDSSLPTPP